MRKVLPLTVVLSFLASFVTALLVPPPADAAGCRSTQVAGGSSRSGRIGGIARPLGHTPRCNEFNPSGNANEAPYQGTPPLIDNGGPVMGTAADGATIEITPVYWVPSGFTMSDSYRSVINNYLDDIAADSGQATNVFSSIPQYTGLNGTFTYDFTVGTPILDTNPFPTSGCTVTSGSIYADGSGYTVCLDDDQIIAETDAQTSASPRDLAHIYVMFTPKGVESCFLPGNPTNQQCTINSTPSAAFCAYHSYFGSTANPGVYANMPFPAYSSATGYSCAGEGLGSDPSGIQSPNGDVDADVEISPLSHELSEAFSDPLLNAWFDSSGGENGDDCAYIYGALSGTDGALYNQSINGHQYLTQEEFSNADYVENTSGCVQFGSLTPPAPSVTGVSPNAGPATGGQSVVLTGSNLSGATSVRFGATQATSFTVNSSTSITAVTPARPAGLVYAVVTTAGGTSPYVTGALYTFAARPGVTSVSPVAGPTTGGQVVTIHGSGFRPGTTVQFGYTVTSAVTLVSSTQLTVRTPAHAAGLVNTFVRNAGGVSAVVTADRYSFDARPAVTSLSPTSGSYRGGQSLTIYGRYFAGPASVVFGTTAVAATVVSSTKVVVAHVPAHARGVVNVYVRTPGGTSATVTADRYTFR